MNADYKVLPTEARAKTANDRFAQTSIQQRLLFGNNTKNPRTSFEQMLKEEFKARKVATNPLKSGSNSDFARLQLERKAISALSDYWSE